MARHERLVERLAAQPVDDAVDRRDALADSARRLHQRGCRRAVRHVEDADAARAEGVDEPAEQGQAVGGRQPLQDPVAVDEIELAAGRKERGGRLEVDVGDPLAFGLPPGGGEHRGGTIDGDDAAGTPCERDGEPAHAAAVLERGHRREFLDEAAPDEVQHPGDVVLAAFEKLALACGGEVRAQVPAAP